MQSGRLNFDSVLVVGCGLLLLPIFLEQSQWGVQAFTSVFTRSAGLLLLTWHAWRAPAPNVPEWTEQLLRWVLLVCTMACTLSGVRSLYLLWKIHLLG